MSVPNHPADVTERLAQAVAHMQHAFSLIHSVDPGIVERLASGAMTPSNPLSLVLPCPETSIVDAGTFSVRWANRTCRLGNTVAFKLLTRLARRPDQYPSYESLRDGIWDEWKSDAAVQSAVKVLRRELNAAGMADLTLRTASSIASSGILALRRATASRSRPTSTTSPQFARSARGPSNAMSGPKAGAGPVRQGRRARPVQPGLHQGR
jgi:hypothetical protein